MSAPTLSPEELGNLLRAAMERTTALLHIVRDPDQSSRLITTIMREEATGEVHGVLAYAVMDTQTPGLSPGIYPIAILATPERVAGLRAIQSSDLPPEIRERVEKFHPIHAAAGGEKAGKS